ncbi:Protein N-acetyltransferase, RimJ/RimL family [Saccharopolyspora antimicrobica]|uniref:Protein N-acetyltransferase, RimJ/RimL family n=1 Tax=Saccharopolyspora antimicrobica TaxID=455193 RepID=A0A1I4TIV5_9PSEU|nr:RimJ/RimL family protein N-acetyltransferase [Saccharopolyspora antimicrobica]SFM76612.1 Protein N-acetyltransferase, RimJ/RimL family [Saccharopolyspora antimicrobica]
MGTFLSRTPKTCCSAAGWRTTVRPVVEPDEIRTERLVLSRPQPTDADAFIALHNTPEAYPHDGWLRRTPEQALEQLDRFREKWAADGIGYWTIRLAGTAEVIGFGGVQHHDEDDGPELNVYYRFFPTAWGRGYATEMVEAALGWARRHRPDRTVRIVTDPANTASVRLAEKLGFTRYLERQRDGHPEVVFRLAAR